MKGVFLLIQSLLNINRSKMYEIYANEKLFSEMLYFSYQNKDSSDISLAQAARRFINMSLLLLINKPSDLLTCIRSVSKRKTLEFLEFIIMHECIDQNVYTFLGCDLELVNKLPKGGWLEVPISHYCAYLLNSTKEKYSVYELLPLYEIAPDDLKEYVFSRGFEQNRLDEASIALFEELFPHKFELLKKV